MNPELESFYLKKKEPERSVLLALRQIILKKSDQITEAWKYGMPFFCLRGKMFCYLWTDRKTGQPYLGIVDGAKVKHPKLIQGKRARMKIFLLDPGKNLPVRTIRGILKKCLSA